MPEPAKKPSAAPALAALAAIVGLGTAAALVDDTRSDEGVVYRAYPDLGGVWSVCSGSTSNVKAGEVDTAEQCDARTAADLTKAATIVLRCSPDLKGRTNQLRAVIRFQNNTGKFCSSSARLSFNAGDLRDGCDRLLAYNGIISLDQPIKGAVQVGQLAPKNGHPRYFNVIRGLVNRRNAEHAICVEGL